MSRDLFIKNEFQKKWIDKIEDHKESLQKYAEKNDLNSEFPYENINWLIEEGYTKNVLILTRPKGYRKTPSRFSKVFRMKAYPKVNHLMELRYKHYNKTLDWIEEEEDKGNIFVIRPTNTLAVDRVEKDPRKLDALYREGYADAEKIYKDLKEYVEK